MCDEQLTVRMPLPAPEKMLNWLRSVEKRLEDERSGFPCMFAVPFLFSCQVPVLTKRMQVRGVAHHARGSRSLRGGIVLRMLRAESGADMLRARRSA